MEMPDILVFTIRGLAVWFLSLLWIYMAARMVGRALLRTLHEAFHQAVLDSINKNPN